MPQIRLTTDRYNGIAAQQAGDVIDVPAAEAAALLNGRMAEPIEPPAPKRATKPRTTDH